MYLGSGRGLGGSKGRGTSCHPQGLGSMSPECHLPPPPRSLPGVTLLFCHEHICSLLIQCGWLRPLAQEAGMGLPHSSGRLQTVPVTMLLSVTHYTSPYSSASSHPSLLACSPTGPVCLALFGAWHIGSAVNSCEHMVASRQH